MADEQGRYRGQPSHEVEHVRGASTNSCALSVNQVLADFVYSSRVFIPLASARVVVYEQAEFESHLEKSDDIYI